MGHVGTPRSTCEKVSVAPLLPVKGQQFLYGPVFYSQGLTFPMQNPLAGAAPMGSLWELSIQLVANGFTFRTATHYVDQ